MKTTLYYKDERSDKVYMAEVVESNGGFMVNFAYGRRGSTLTTGTKTQSPVSKAEAEKIFDKLIVEKKAKGYTEGEDGAVYSESTGEHSGVFPQLLNELTEDGLRFLLSNDLFCAQQKYDGRRMMVRKTGKTEAINRKGLVVGAPQEILDQVAQIPGEFILDGEAIGDVLHVFDILPLNVMDGGTLRERLHCLGQIPRLPNVQPVYTAYTTDDKLALYAKLTAQKAEGIVFKNLLSLYTPGRPSTGFGDWMKFKFYATLSAIVMALNTGKRSVKLKLHDGNYGFTDIGNVTIPPNHEIPAVGSVVEVRYLYATAAGILYQPVYLGRRTDLYSDDCLISQLKYKGEEDDEG